MTYYMSKKYTPGSHPNSRANLTYHKGRPKVFSTTKKKRNLTVTEEGWEGLKPVLESTGCNSVSEFLEKVGRGQIEVLSSPKTGNR